jgi:hypothetical protein
MLTGASIEVRGRGEKRINAEINDNAKKRVTVTNLFDQDMLT